VQVRYRLAAAALAVLGPSLAGGSRPAAGAGPPAPGATDVPATPALRAAGAFDVKLTPEGQDERAEGSTLGRMSLAKQYHGDLQGTASGTILTALTSVEGSAGYVGIERVTGVLGGRAGSFLLQHSGTMTRGAQQLSVTVVPDSGSGQLVGLAGRMAITIEGRKHSYVFEYTVPKVR
jgi:hypothetical protein